MPTDVMDTDQDELDHAADPSRVGSQWMRRFGPLLVAVPPMLWMASFVIRGGKLPFYDYWYMVDAVFKEDGGIHLSGLLTFQNEHPVVIPDLLYLLNARLTGGSNLALGFVVIAVVFAQVVILSRYVQERYRATWTGLGMIGASSVLLFCRQEAHLFFAAYSAPIANLFALGAILVCSRRRIWLAVALGILASLSNAVGLMVWPALIVTGMVRNQRWRPDPVVTVYGVLCIVGWLALRTPEPRFYDPTVWGITRAALAVAGSLLTDSVGVAQLIAVAGLLAGGALTWLVLRRGQTDVAVWVGALAFALAGAALIGGSRSALVLSLGVEGRYGSVSAIFLIALLGLTATALRYRTITLVPIVIISLVALSRGGAEMDKFVQLEPDQEDLAAALRLDLADGFAYLPYFGYPRVATLLEAADHYPFDGNWDGDCGLTGQHITPSTAPDPDDGRLERVELLDNHRGARFFGWLSEEIVDEVNCVVVTDSSGTVVGSGVVGVRDSLSDLDRDQTFAAVAPLGPAAFSVSVVLDDGSVQQLAGQVASPAPPPAVGQGD